MTKTEVLKKYFGYTSFRRAQETVIDAVLDGNDVVGIMPTGAGKSLCYQIPAILLPGTTIVVSPLISLMKDQVAGLREKNIPAAFINSSLTTRQYNEVLRRTAAGQYKIIYVAPERLETTDFKRFAYGTDISLVAVDEAHCVSQWGQDFRPSYLKIADFTAGLTKCPVTGAFTATATKQVKRDIIRLLRLKNPVSITTGFDRPNLYFSVEHPTNKVKHLTQLVSERRNQCGVVYCSTRKTVERICEILTQKGICVTRYHAGLDDIERRKNQDSFINGDINIIVATNAFGMGIDRPDVRFVIHYNMPKNMESYYQEAGRAGRDGNPSECILLFSEKDIKIAENLINDAHDSGEMLSKQERRRIRRLDERRLNRMVRYCDIDFCLRLYILSYFGEKQTGKCGNCSNCLKPGFWKSIKHRFTF